MKRRQFLQMLAATGMTTGFAGSVNKAWAAPTPPDHFLVVINAGGGWDPTSLCDPKGNLAQYPERATNNYDGSINSVAINPANLHAPSGIRWSDTPILDGTSDAPGALTTRISNQFDTFFQTYASRMTVINGIDNGTNNHSTGNRATWSGNLDTGYPSLAALFATSKNPSLPMAFISNGGYDFTASLVARARASSANFIDTLADPNAESFLYKSAQNAANQIDQFEAVRIAQRARLSRQQESVQLPKRRAQLNQLFTVRQDDNNLGQLSAARTGLENALPVNGHMNNRASSMKNQASLVIAAFQSGIAASANISSGGFDTHGNHDRNQYQSLGDLLEGTVYLMEAISQAGLQNRTTVVMGSDFGRTPFYNSGNGKDHWPVTSMIVLHDTAGNKGGRVFGSTTGLYQSQTLNTASGQPDTQGQLLTPAHVNAALRRELGMENHVSAEAFPLDVDHFNIFG